MGVELIQRYFPGLTGLQLQQFEKLLPLYTEWNEKINVISRKDMDAFYEHHVLHSLAIAKFISFKPGTRVLDFGTGGGFPGIPLAILFPEASFHLVDSIGKKITVVNEVVNALELKNVIAEKQRVEELKSTYDFITCRGVTDLTTIIKWTTHLFTAKWKNDKANGWLLLKGGDIKSELKDAEIKPEKISLSDYYKAEFFAEKYLLYIRR